VATERGHRVEERAHDAETEQAERRPSANRLTLAEVARVGMRQIADFTGRSPEGVTSVEPTEDGWFVEVEVLEDKHIPSSSDVLALYEVVIDQHGDLESYRRIRRYARGRAMGNGS
jgi:hypothetical protein